jgi:hypothetical protein
MGKEQDFSLFSEFVGAERFNALGGLQRIMTAECFEFRSILQAI